MPHKYNVGSKESRTYRDTVYASAAEARRAMELDALVAAGEIHCWKRGVPIELIPRPNRITYVPDFQVCNVRVTPTSAEGGYWVEEVKGFETPLWKAKKKLMAHFHPGIEVRVLKAR